MAPAEASEEVGKVAALKVTLGDIHINNIGQLRKLNEATFPVRYADKFYTEIPTLQTAFTQFAYFGGFAIGAICGRIEPTADPARSKLYIMTIGVLVAYRDRGVGRFLLDYLLENAAKRKDIAMVYLHVQTSNQGALDFYAKAGFGVVGKIENYYKRIEPPDCFVLAKLVHDKEDKLPAVAQELGFQCSPV
ncbi:acyl-CoA N-acyltransferase [Pelagophyceae sp. CCMP2097]|nr:acyl-CoA N-acyltransferase [Pelagophyceae sp. CCMP2097]|mmetsp:Transcript_8779/g.28898  ORF Transcript_8779/g.28898 Transcript_8779/m.28898 type:complete len:191 (+) Transcript_8779:95-667(+)